MIDNAIMGDSKEPGTERVTLPLERVDGLQHTQEHLFGQVLSFNPVTYLEVHIAINLRMKRLI
jgi:hypothetical protein